MGHATFVLKIPETILYIHRSPANKYSNPTLPQFVFPNKRKKRSGLDLASRIRYLDEKRNPERSRLVLIKKCLRPKIDGLITLLYILTTTIENMSKTFFACRIAFQTYTKYHFNPILSVGRNCLSVGLFQILQKL